MTLMTVYRATPNLQVVHYDEESVVFNPVTWDTHVLNAAAAEVLALCAEAGCTLEQVEQALKVWLNADEAEHAHAHATQTLESLSALGLIDDVG